MPSVHIETIRAKAAWKEIKRMAIYPEVADALMGLRELRLNETRLTLGKRIQWGFTKWMKPKVR